MSITIETNNSDERYGLFEYLCLDWELTGTGCSENRIAKTIKDSHWNQGTNS